MTTNLVGGVNLLVVVVRRLTYDRSGKQSIAEHMLSKGDDAYGNGYHFHDIIVATAGS